MQKYRTSGGPTFDNNENEDTQETEQSQPITATSVLAKVKALQKQKKKEEPREICEYCTMCGHLEEKCGGDKENGKWTEEWRKLHVARYYVGGRDKQGNPIPKTVKILRDGNDPIDYRTALETPDGYRVDDDLIPYDDTTWKVLGDE